VGTRRLTRWLASAVVAALLLTTFVPVASAGTRSAGNAPAAPALRPGAPISPSGLYTWWAWLTLRDATAQTQPVAPKDSGNALGGTNTVTYNGNGRYTVNFAMVGSPGGIVNLNVLGTKNRVCNVLSWGSPFTTAGPY
jgi:hypothetical protein